MSKKKQPVKRRSAVALDARLRRGGPHTDKRFRKNLKKRKVNIWDGWK